MKRLGRKARSKIAVLEDDDEDDGCDRTCG